MNQEFSLWSFWAGVALMSTLNYLVPIESGGARLALAAFWMTWALAVWALGKGT